MKNIIPFKKDVIFKTTLSEVTSISLEHTLTLNKDTVEGNFIVSGEYKISDNSNTVEPFNLELPFEIVIDEKYNTTRAVLDIDDFYYEIINNNILSIAIDVLIDKLEEKPLIDIDDLVEIEPVREVLEYEEEDTMEEEKSEVKEEKNEKEEVEEKINSLFSQTSDQSENYVTYNVFILREGDSLDTIMDKYNVTLEDLKKYNELDSVQLGDKIIIPNTYERD